MDKIKLRRDIKNKIIKQEKWQEHIIKQLIEIKLN